MTKLDEERGEILHHWPQVLPGGRAVLFTAATGHRDYEGASIQAVSLETGRRVTVREQAHFGRYVPTGHVVFVHQGTLFAVAFDADRLEVTGSPFPVLEGVERYTNTGSAAFDFSASGTLTYFPATGASEKVTAVWADREGKTRPLLTEPRDYFDPRISPDSKRLAICIGANGGPAEDLWIYDLERGTLTRLTYEPGEKFLPVWTPDGERVVYAASTTRSGNPNLHWKRADGVGEAEVLFESEERKGPGSWAPDGEVLAFMQVTSQGDPDIWTLRREADGWKAEPLITSPFVEIIPEFSPDGRWLAYASNEAGRMEIYVRPFPGPGGRWQISTDGGNFPRWSRAGRELFYRSGNKTMAVRYDAEGSSFRASTPQTLFEGDFPERALGSDYDAAPDGKRFVMFQSSREDSPTRTPQPVFVFNWFEELRRLAPAGKR